MKKIIILFWLASTVAIMSIMATELDDFSAMIRSMKIVKMGFTQQILSFDGIQTSSAKGILWYKPEKYFRIEYTAPDKEIIVTNDNGYKIYNFDDDEESGGKLEDIVFISPFTMLGELNKYFTVKTIASRIYRLESKSDATGDIGTINCEFKTAKKYPTVMSVHLKTGNIVKYTFSSLAEGEDQPGLFSFSSMRKTFGSN